MTVNRRTLLGASAAAGAAAAVAAASPAEAKRAKRYSFTVMGTTDLHGNVFNWDYFADKEYADAAGNTRGIARIATLVKQVREAKGRKNTLLIDSGDTIQGTPLAYYYARVDPIAAEAGPVHPMAQSMNEIGYDAAALGNHEFNYGLDTLRKFESQLEFPLLGANTIDVETGRPAFPPYHMVRMRTGCGKDVKVAILGLCTPGVSIWDKAYVDGVLEFPSLESEAAHWVPRLKEMGADVVVISAHSGTSGKSAYDTATGLGVENASVLVAQQVSGIDAILVGHAHVEIEELRVADPDGHEVVLSNPLCYGQRLTLFDFELVLEKGKWTVESVKASILNSNEVEEDERIAQILSDEHNEVVTYVNQVVAEQAVVKLTTAEARYKDEPIIDLIAKVQEDTVTTALAGTEYAGLPVIAQASPFSRTAELPAANVKIKDLSGLYIYDNTLVAKLMTGAQVRAYLEYSAQYFVQTPAGAEVVVDTAAKTDNITGAEGRPDYNYDYVSGLSYEIDIAKPVGSRIANLKYQGADLADDQRFVMAVNNYRANGGGNFPHVAAAQELWSESIEIRTRIIEWVTAKGRLDPADFAAAEWVLTREGTPVF
ncbi:bifunctional metallophosphatase/5'-nucleotidase [Glycomyces algeriensis]|uniref:Multifunctional 2',3'-cyclic-nucleotide 2'-phosphodiesterase/5'-nucleotidase/3'-nucleotidase n=1 Tax=Glycomyces algeriensis TaxID=256037 RepID=A0A9W6G9H2_9ACTN|nr:5'-nucleotidase C-terminal domain-containing protein [Glycomyces algeriensis]MDA1364942.1 5'-nucleotidase C-terminal domain-containing protein [Glycomyces algeriensis]MDR7349997.1 2',3'-cyclic-nucleotide 2'-phosphodiesterase/3'-nucleotidase [Glycomyces algeriensis]GLI42708.1 multifunctional 2',3'-cyclic-nucleotide 2'-phosphodiesterase/5'-nucleotidase/3'-nucleotidase [Glycomyces algeriensis]